MQLQDIAQALEVEEPRAHDYLKDIGFEGNISIVFIHRTRFYGLPLGY